MMVDLFDDFFGESETFDFFNPLEAACGLVQVNCPLLQAVNDAELQRRCSALLEAIQQLPVIGEEDFQTVDGHGFVVVKNHTVSLRLTNIYPKT